MPIYLKVIQIKTCRKKTDELLEIEKDQLKNLDTNRIESSQVKLIQD